MLIQPSQGLHALIIPQSLPHQPPAHRTAVVGQFAYCLCSLGWDATHSGGKGGGGQKEKQMYNNETATNNITKNTIYLLTHLLFTAFFSEN